jgi:hypothetical protein
MTLTHHAIFTLGSYDLTKLKLPVPLMADYIRASTIFQGQIDIYDSIVHASSMDFYKKWL